MVFEHSCGIMVVASACFTIPLLRFCIVVPSISILRRDCVVHIYAPHLYQRCLLGNINRIIYTSRVALTWLLKGERPCHLLLTETQSCDESLYVEGNRKLNNRKSIVQVHVSQHSQRARLCISQRFRDLCTCTEYIQICSQVPTFLILLTTPRSNRQQRNPHT